MGSSEVWRFAGERSAQFEATALDYDRYRPRYPTALFDDLSSSAGAGSRPASSGAASSGAASFGTASSGAASFGTASSGAAARRTMIEVGAGTGIATVPLVEHGFEVTAIEPAAGMAAVGRDKTGDDVTWVVGRFEDVALDREVGGPVDVLASFNAWHWIEPVAGVARAAELVRPGGLVALVWTEVVSWGGDAFESRLADAFGAVWPKHLPHIAASMAGLAGDPRFAPFETRRHRFERDLSGPDLVAVTRTYGGRHSVERDEILLAIVEDLGGSVTKVEDAVLHLARRH